MLVIARSLHQANGISDMRNQFTANATSIDYAAGLWQVFRPVIAGAMDKMKMLIGEDVANILRISMRKVDRVKRRFVEEGMGAALGWRQDQRGYERKADGEFEAHLVALSCGEPPECFARWSLRLLADRAVELAAWQARRDQIHAKVIWQFTTEKARIKLKRLYPIFEA